VDRERKQMKKINVIKKIEDAAGRTISKAAIDSDDEKIAIRFTDDSVIGFQIMGYGDCGCIEICGETHLNRDYRLLIELGLMSEEEWIEKEKEERKAWEKSVEDKQRREYERLKAKFG
jgi:hypothetical protein